MKLPRAHHLSPKELAGQVLMPMIDCRFKNRADSAARKISRMIQRFHVGGFILFYGHPADVRYWTSVLQRESKYPLLFAADLERGLRSVFSEGTLFPHAMAFGAARESHLTEAFAHILAKEIRSVGINVLFGPALDLANDPDNPIINIRAFHHSPNVVSEQADVIIRVVQKYGIACVGKHFPGHGATTLDSHDDLPELYKSLPELQKEELLPYPAAISANVKGLMASHLKVPGFQNPASLEPDLIQKVIREKWKYRGVVFTDALEMGAIKNTFSYRDQALLPLNAGADILLMPNQLPLAHRLLTEQIKNDADFRYKVEQSVERIFALKKWIHKQKPAQDHPYRVNKVVANPTHIGIARKVAERAVTLVQRSDRFPLNLPKIKSIHHLIFTDSAFADQPLQNFCEELRFFFEGVVIHNNPSLATVKRIKPARNSVVVISLYIRTYANNKQRLDWNTIHQVLQVLEKNDSTKIIFLFGNPYRLNDLTNPSADAIFLVYSYVQASQEAAFNALISSIDIQGDLPVPLKAPFANSQRLASKNYSLSLNLVSQKKWQSINKLIEKAIEEKVFPGCVLLAAQQGQIILKNAYGKFDYSDDAKQILPDTVYDLASITKVAATTLAVMKLVEQSHLQLSDTLDQFYGGLATDKSNITIADLLAHQSGLPAWKSLYETARGTVAFIEQILNTPLEYATGKKTIYSDLGFILLFDIVEKITGLPFDVFCRGQLFEPMGLQSLKFTPSPKLWQQIPPTGTDALRSKTIQGQVNDANCFAMDGISGHAGLFGTAEDVAAVGQLFIQKGIYRKRRHFKASTIELFSKLFNPKVSARTLGWDTPTLPSSSGQYFSQRSIGHLGFTGTSLWIDLEREIVIVLLSNRVHPDSENTAIKQFRPEIHDAVMGELLGEKIKDKVR